MKNKKIMPLVMSVMMISISLSAQQLTPKQPEPIKTTVPPPGNRPELNEPVGQRKEVVAPLPLSNVQPVPPSVPEVLVDPTKEQKPKVEVIIGPKQKVLTPDQKATMAGTAKKPADLVKQPVAPEKLPVLKPVVAPLPAIKE